MIRTLAALTLLASPTLGAQVYRCEDAAGQTVFSQTPCADDAQVVDIDPPPAAAPPMDEPAPGLRPGELEMLEEGKQRRQKRAGSRQRQSAMYQNQVMVGMTEEQVRRAWGAPDKINRSSGGREQWIYRRGEFDSQYVYLEAGRVTGWN